MRRARPDEIEVVLAVLADAAAWLRTRRVEQWPDRFPTDWVLPAIEAGETWLAELDGQIVGSLVVQWDDPLFWAGSHLRLDCVASNESLRAYYGRAAYEHVGGVTVGEYVQARYEKRVET